MAQFSSRFVLSVATTALARRGFRTYVLLDEGGSALARTLKGEPSMRISTMEFKVVNDTRIFSITFNETSPGLIKTNCPKDIK